VTNRARQFFQGKDAHPSFKNRLHPSADLLKGSRYEKDVDLITDRFDKTIEPLFRNVNDNYWIQFSGPHVKNTALKIKAGRLPVQGYVWSISIVVDSAESDLVLISSLSSIPQSKISCKLSNNKLLPRVRKSRCVTGLYDFRRLITTLTARLLVCYSSGRPREKRLPVPKYKGTS